MNLSRQAVRVVAVAATTCAALAVSASLTVAKDPKWIGPINQPPGEAGQATIELKIHFGHKSHGSKKLVPKSLLAKERNVYYSCLDGENGYPTDGGGDGGLRNIHVDFEATMFIKKNGTFGDTDTTVGDSDSGSNSIQGRITGHTATGTIRMENHRNNGSPPPNDPLTCDSGVLTWTASAP